MSNQSFVFFNKRPDVSPCRQPVPFGLSLNGFPFGGIERKPAADTLIINSGASCLIGAFPTPCTIAHCFTAKNIDRTIVLIIKPIAAIVRHFIRNAVSCSFVILHSLKKDTMFKGRGLRPADNYYLIAVNINTIKVPIAASASNRLDIAFIQSAIVMRWRLFLSAIHGYLLFFNDVLIIPKKQKLVKSFVSLQAVLV